MKLKRSDHNRFIQQLDRTAEKNPLLWLPCILLIALALVGEHIAEYVKIVYSHRNTEKVIKAKPHLERKPFALRAVAMTLVMAFSFMLMSDLGQDVYADEYHDFENSGITINTDPYENSFGDDFNGEQGNNDIDLSFEKIENTSEFNFETYSYSESNNGIFANGQCGDNAYYTLTEDGVMTIYGSGSTYAYTHYSSAPFAKNNVIREVIIENGITHIGGYFFYECTNLEKVTIPNSVTQIGWSAFEYCRNIKNIVIPDSVTYLGRNAFCGCTNLSDITLSDNLTEIPMDAFRSCSSLTNIILPSSITQIGVDAFTSCTSLANIVIPRNVAEIEHGAFWKCFELTSVVILNKNTIINSNLVLDCPKATIYGYRPSTAETYAIENNILFKDISEFLGTIDEIPSKGQCGDNAYWELSPEGIFTVTGTGAIYDYEFNVDDLSLNEPWQNSNVKKAVIKDGITEIGNDFLMYCSELESIELPQSLKRIGDAAFANTKLNNITIPDNVNSIGNFAFEGCQELKEVTLPSNLAELSNGLFNYCGVKKVELPKNLRKIGSSFTHCAIEYLDIPHSVTYIESGAFFRCSIKEITIPNGVSSIESATFEDCWELEKVIIPPTVININNNAFIGCQNLTIYGYLGTASETYAKDNGIPFVSINNDELVDFRSKDKINVPCLGEITEQIWYNGTDDIVDFDYEITDESIVKITKTEISNRFEFPRNDWENDHNETIENPFNIRRVVTATLQGLKPGSTTLKVTINNEHTSFITVVVDDVNLVVSSDRTNLCLYLHSYGDELTVNAALKSNEQVIYVDDTYEFSLSYDRSALEIYGSYIEGKGATYKIKPLKQGVFNVTITDNKFGLVKIIPITVLDTMSGFSFTVNNVPVTDDGMQTNFTLSGMYIDCFKHEKTDKGNRISFDVYNHTYAYGIVDVYDKDSNYIKSVLLSPYGGLPTSIKQATWDNLKELFVEWVIEDTLLTYRQETGMCKKTHVDIPDVPTGGYITITNNPALSIPLTIVDGFDMIFSVKSVATSFDPVEGKNLVGSLQDKLPVIIGEITNKIAKDGNDKYVRDLSKKIAKAFVSQSGGFEFNGEILEEFATWLQSYNFNDAVIDILFSSGFSMLEDVIYKFGGIYGSIINGAFIAYEYINFACQVNSWLDVSHWANNAIYIHVPESGITNCKNISATGEFDEYTSLNVYELSIDDEILNHLPDYISQSTIDEIAEATKLIYPYNITLFRNGKEIQPSGKISVSIAIPFSIMRYLSDDTVKYLKLIRIEPNGTQTEMPISITDDNCVLFETNHLSNYILYYDYIAYSSDISNRMQITIPDLVTVKRGNATLSNGEYLNTGDVLTIEANVLSGFILKSLKVNGIEFSSGNTYTVGNEDVIITVEFAEIEETPVVDPSIKPYVSQNIGKHDYINGYRSASVITSYITELPNGTLERVEYIDGKGIVVENYFKDGRTISQKIVSMELTHFGGFFSGKNFNFIVVGQDNPNLDDNAEVLRIVKYTKDWKRLDAFSFKASDSKGYCGIDKAETKDVFSFGTLRMAESGDNLIVHTCHGMFNGHQSNMPFIINQSDMTFVKFAGYYASHSFNQFVKTDSNFIYYVDHGDAYPRGIVLGKLPVDLNSSVGSDREEVFKIYGEYDVYGNDTGVSVGDFELSDTGTIIVGNSVSHNDQNTYDPYGQRNIFLITIGDKFSNFSTKWITNYSKGVEIGNPYLIKLSGSCFAIMWEETLSKGQTTIKYLTVDNGGNMLTPTVSISARLSDCQPILTSENNIMWYYTNNSTPFFVTIDLNGNVIDNEIDIPSHIHSFSNNWNKDSTYHWHECTVCGEHSDTAQHNEYNVEDTVKPTATTSGIRTYYCSVCGYAVRTETIPPISDPNPLYPVNPTPSYPTVTYPTNTQTVKEPYIYGDNSKSGWNMIISEIDFAPNDSTVRINMNGTTELPKDAVSHIQNRNINLELNMNSAIWTINGLDVTKPKTVNLRVSERSNKIPTSVMENLISEIEPKEYRLYHSGDFGFKATLTLSVGKKYNNYYAELYHYNTKTKQLEFVDENLVANRQVTFEVTHASYYAVAFNGVPMYEDVSSSAGVFENSVPIETSAMPETSGVTIPAVKLPQIMKYSNKKRRYRILRKRRLDDLVFVM